MSAQVGPRRPNWPIWVYGAFNVMGLHMLYETYMYLKQSSGLDRAAKLSADDVASSVYAQLKSAGETKYFKAAPATSEHAA
jgi:hypothetical protein